MQSTSARLRSIVRAIPGARPLRRAVLDFWARRGAAHDTVPPRGALNRPEVVTIDRRAVTFDGWALVGRRTAATVDVVLNEMTTVHASLGSARPDVPVSLSEPTAIACGWTAKIDLAQWPLGDLRMKVIATSRSGMSSVIGHRMYTLIGEGFEGYLDTPPEGAEVHGDLLIVQGWATVGQRPASRIDIHLNGRYAGRARLRVVRSDVERHGAGRLGPVTGFEYRGVLTPNDVGRLEIAITVHALDGTTVAVPPRHVRVVVDDQAIDEARVRTVRDRTEAALAGMPPSPVVAGAIPPSLLVFTHSLALGGGQLYLSELLRQLAPSLAHCIVVAPTDGVLRQGLETDGIEVRILEDPPYGDISQYEDYVRDRAMLIRSSGCNVALLNTLGPWAAGDACSRAGLPFVWAIHESFELSDWIALNFGASAASGYIRRQMETALRAAHRLVFEAKATSEMFAHVADATHRTVVAYGVDTGRIAAFARDFDRAASATRTRHPSGGNGAAGDGRLRRAQIAGLDRRGVHGGCGRPSKRAADPSRRPSLRVFGCDSPNRGRLLMRRAHLVRPDHHGNMGLVRAVRSARLSIGYRVLPRSMLECMAFGVPVLSTDVFGVPEVVEDGVNGWLFESRDMGSVHRLDAPGAFDDT